MVPTQNKSLAKTRVCPQDAAVPNTLYSRVVARACELLGGPEALATRIGVSALMVRAWMTGALRPPTGYFFKVIDILNEAEPDSPALRANDSGNAAGKDHAAD